MNGDIVQRLRGALHYDRSVELMAREAADEIERLQAEVICLKYQNAEFVRNLTMAQDERNDARRVACDAYVRQIRNPFLRVEKRRNFAKRHGWPVSGE